MKTQNTLGARPIITGMWKFKDSVPVGRLMDLAHSWAESKDGYCYTDLHIRKCSTNQYGIGFKYALDPGISDKEWDREHKKFFHKMKAQLRQEFRGEFSGWDVSSSTYIVK